MKVTQSSLKDRSAKQKKIGDLNESLVNIWPFYFRSKDYFSILWPFIDFDPYGIAIRPLYNQEGDDHSILFPLSSWNTNTKSGWVFNTVWFPGTFLFLPLVVHREKKNNDIFQMYTPLFIRIVKHPDWAQYKKKNISFAPGGKTRTESVMNGVLYAGNTDIVCIHDCARPFITAENIDDVVNAVYETGASCACKAVTDTIKYTDEKGTVQYTPKRDRLIAVQTPQVFRKDIYLVAAAMGKKNKLTATDDTTLAEAAGFKVKYVNIGDNNDKLTTAEDIKRAKARIFLDERTKEGSK